MTAITKDVLMEKTATELLDQQVLRTPDEVAVSYKGTVLSYGELQTKANRLARRLVRLGVRPGDRVPLFLEKGPGVLIGMLGIWKAGGVYVPIDEGNPVARVVRILEESEARVVISDGACLQVLPAERSFHIVSPDDSGHVDEGPDDGAPADRVSDNGSSEEVSLPVITPGATAYIIYTSGSTGRPKGVMVSHGNLSYFLRQVRKKYAANKPLVMPFMASPAFDISLFQIFLPWLSGGTCVVLDKEQMLNPEQLAAVLKDVTAIDTVPAVYAVLAGYLEINASPGSFDHIQRLFIGGDAIPDELLQRLALLFPEAVITVTYGPTEGTIFCTDLSYEAACLPAVCKGTVIGRPFGQTQIYILDKDLSMAPLGATGEICLGGRGVSQGYFGNEEQTIRKFLRHPLADDEIIYRTGDLGRWMPDGNLTFAGRIDNQVKIRGYRIEPGEVETVLGQSPGVHQCAVLVRKDRQGNNRLIGYVVPGEQYHKEHTLHYLRSWLPEHMIPTLLLELDSLPLNSNGKLDRQALPDPDAGHLLSHPYVAPRNETEWKLTYIWQELLGVDHIGVHDNFFELGGHSLMAMRLSAALKKDFDRDVPIRVIFELMNIEGIAQFIQIALNNNEVEGSDDYEKIEL